jgi:hypothetical protein
MFRPQISPLISLSSPWSSRRTRRNHLKFRRVCFRDVKTIYKFLKQCKEMQPCSSSVWQTAYGCKPTDFLKFGSSFLKLEYQIGYRGGLNTNTKQGTRNKEQFIWPDTTVPCQMPPQGLKLCSQNSPRKDNLSCASFAYQVSQPSWKYPS